MKIFAILFVGSCLLSFPAHAIMEPGLDEDAYNKMKSERAKNSGFAIDREACLAQQKLGYKISCPENKSLKKEDADALNASGGDPRKLDPEDRENAEGDAEEL